MNTLELKDDHFSNPFDIREMAQLALKRKWIIIVFFFLSLSGVLIYSRLSPETYSTRLFIQAVHVSAVGIKYILNDLEVLLSNRSDQKNQALLSTYFTDPEMIHSIHSSVISEDGDENDNILTVEIITYSDSLIYSIKDDISDYLTNNKFLRLKSELEKSHLSDKLSIINESTKNIERTIKEADSLMQSHKNIILPTSKGELISTYVKLAAEKSSLNRQINDFQPFIIMNDPIFVETSTPFSKIRLFLVCGLVGAMVGFFVVLLQEYFIK